MRYGIRLPCIGLWIKFAVSGMKGFLAFGSVVVDRKRVWVPATGLFTKAFVVPARDKSARAEENFIVKAV